MERKRQKKKLGKKAKGKEKRRMRSRLTRARPRPNKQGYPTNAHNHLIIEACLFCKMVHESPTLSTYL